MRGLSLVLLSLVLASPSALGLGGDLAGPSIAHPANLDPARKKQIKRLYAHMREKLVFLEGSFINEFSYQRFGGSAQGLLGLIERLNEIGLWQVEVQFRDFGEQDSAFSMDQNSATSYVRVMVNSGREDFRIRDFRAWLPKPALPVNRKGEEEK